MMNSGRPTRANENNIAGEKKLKPSKISTSKVIIIIDCRVLINDIYQHYHEQNENDWYGMHVCVCVYFQQIIFGL